MNTLSEVLLVHTFIFLHLKHMGTRYMMHTKIKFMTRVGQVHRLL